MRVLQTDRKRERERGRDWDTLREKETKRIARKKREGERWGYRDR